jgi:hypothetical protein
MDRPMTPIPTQPILLIIPPRLIKLSAIPKPKPLSAASPQSLKTEKYNYSTISTEKNYLPNYKNGLIRND